MRTSRTSDPVVIITMGDPAGIGPEIIMRSMASPEVQGLAVFIVVGDAAVLKGLSADTLPVGVIGHPLEAVSGRINIIDPAPPLADNRPGVPSDEGAEKAVKIDMTTTVIASRAFRLSIVTVRISSPFVCVRRAPVSTCSACRVPLPDPC